jgi:DNA polymerase III delta subunit
MITTLTGSNGYELQSKLRDMISSHESTYGDLAIERIDGEEADFGNLQHALAALPLFTDKKLVILRAPSKQKKFVENIEHILKLVPESTDVIIFEPHLDKRLSYFKFLSAHTNYREMQTIDALGLAKWLVERAQSMNGHINIDTAKMLVERVGEDQQMLAKELEKLLLYDSQVSRESILLLTDATPQGSIFELLESAFNGKTDRVLALYEEQRQQNVEPAQVIAMLSWQLHILALIKTAGARSVSEVSRISHVKEYSLRRSYAIADRLTLSEIKEIIASLLDIDLRLKRENLDPDEMIQNLLLRITYVSSS